MLSAEVKDWMLDGILRAHYCSPKLRKLYLVIPDSEKPSFLRGIETSIVDHAETDGKFSFNNFLGRGDDIRIQEGSFGNPYGKVPSERHPLVRILTSHGAVRVRPDGDVRMASEEVLERAFLKWSEFIDGDGIVKKHEAALQRYAKLDLSRRSPDGPHLTFGNLRKKDGAKVALATKDWDKLKEITAGDLRLFKSSDSCILRGEIVVNALLLTGVHTVFREQKTGRLFSLSLYNCLPVESTGTDLAASAEKLALARTMFRVGTHIAIAHPYFKIAVDGTLSIRVDDPRNIRGPALPVASISDAKLAGNAALKSGRAEYARMCYRSCFEHPEMDDFVTLLSNRCATQLKMAEAEMDKFKDDSGDRSSLNVAHSLNISAMMDAALLLMLRPQHEKGWQRYLECMKLYSRAATALGSPSTGDLIEKCASTAHAEEMGGRFFPDTEKEIEELCDDFYRYVTAAISVCFPEEDAQPMLPTDDKKTDESLPMPAPDEIVSCARQLATDGTKKHKGKRFGAARRKFTEALLLYGSTKPLAQVLSNLAHVDILLGRDLEAMAYAFGVFRVCSAHEPVDIDEVFRESSADSGVQNGQLVNGCIGREFPELIKKAKFRLAKCITRIGANGIFEEANRQRESKIELEKLLGGKVSSEYVLPSLEIRPIDETKGRGVFTTSAFPKDAVIAGFSITGLSFRHDVPKLDVALYDDKVANFDSFGVGLKNKFLWRMAEDSGLAWRLDFLHDGSDAYEGSALRSIPFRFILNSIPPIALPFLPPSPDFVVGRTPVLNEHRVQMILSVNSHGAGNIGYLCPSQCMVNHADKMSESWNIDMFGDPADEERMLVRTTRAVPAGAELMTNYFSSRPAASVCAKWGV